MVAKHGNELMLFLTFSSWDLDSDAISFIPLLPFTSLLSL